MKRGKSCTTSTKGNEYNNNNKKETFIKKKQKNQQPLRVSSFQIFELFGIFVFTEETKKLNMKQ